MTVQLVHRLPAARKLLHDQRRYVLVGPLVVGILNPKLIYLAIDYVRDLAGWVWTADGTHQVSAPGKSLHRKSEAETDG